ncbi:MAG: histidine kinase [Anaerolineae bacterium]|jgi:two-component system sensor histidine kinase DegS|nr:histidine kinase [Anaerolineae bacterium]
MMNNPIPAAAQDAKQQLMALLNEELGTLKRRISEIRAQITQQQVVVDREEQRNSDIASHLITIRHSIEGIPREDIRDRYEEALEARQRLATMRAQLERFQSSLDLMQTNYQLMQQVASKIQGSDLNLDEEHEDGASARASLNMRRIVEAQEAERQRLARQMHDGPAQSLTNFILKAEICQRLFDKSPQDAAEELNNLKTDAKLTLGKVRDFIFDLRPMMLDDLGLIPTTRRYVARFKDRADLDIELEIVGEERSLEDYRQILLFRGVQELIAHARDYASASRVRIRMDLTSNLIKVLVEDDGRGFDPDLMDSADENKLPNRLRDLVTMREKFSLAKGAMRVSSSETGSTIRLELPNTST